MSKTPKPPKKGFLESDKAYQRRVEAEKKLNDLVLNGTKKAAPKKADRIVKERCGHCHGYAELKNGKPCGNCNSGWIFRRY